MEPDIDPTAFYQNFLENPLLAPLANLPAGETLKKKLGHLPPKPNANVRAFPTEARIILLSMLRQIHVPLGRDVQLASLVFDLIRDGYLSRNPTPARIRNREEQVSRFVECAIEQYNQSADYEAAGGALIGMSGTGKTRTLKRVLKQVPQVVEHDVRKNPLLPPKMVTHIRVECPSNHTPTALVTSIFTAFEAAIGEELPARVKTGNLSNQAQNMAQVCLDFCLGVLIVDEIQHILQRDGAPEPKLLNFFVEFSNKLEVPILLVGTPRAQHVVAGEMRQARRMLGPEWSNLKKDSKAWKDLIDELWQYQFTREFTPFAAVADPFYRLTQGVPALAVTLFRVAQRYAIEMEACGKEVFLTEGLLEAVYTDHFRAVDPMVQALASGDPQRISLYEDLKIDGKLIEDEMLQNLARYREQCRIKLMASTTKAFRNAKKEIRAHVSREAATLATTPTPEVAATAKLMSAYREATVAGTDPATAVLGTVP